MKSQLVRLAIRKHAPFLVMLAFAIAIHLPIFGDALNPDSTTYLEASRSLIFNGSLRIETSLAPRHPPLMALILAPFGLIFGFNEFAVHLFELSGFTALLALVYAVSQKLGHPFSLIPCTLLSLDPVLYLNMSDGRALCLLMGLALVTLIAVWRGLTDTRWLLIAAVGASLAYLTADTVGYIFVVGGLAGLLWRFYYDRWAIFRNTRYLAAMSLFCRRGADVDELQLGVGRHRLHGPSGRGISRQADFPDAARRRDCCGQRIRRVLRVVPRADRDPVPWNPGRPTLAFFNSEARVARPEDWRHAAVYRCHGGHFGGCCGIFRSVRAVEEPGLRGHVSALRRRRCPGRLHWNQHDSARVGGLDEVLACTVHGGSFHLDCPVRAPNDPAERKLRRVRRDSD